MKRGLRWSALCAFAFATASQAEEPTPPPAPVLLIVNQSIGLQQPKSVGLTELAIAMWSTSAVNKESKVKVARFEAAMRGVSLVEDARAAFGCFAATGECSAPPACTDVDEFSKALAQRTDRSGYVVEITPLLIPEQLAFRAIGRRMKLSNDVNPSPIKVGVAYTAVFTTRAPAKLAGQRKTNPAALEAYWAEGEPMHIVRAASHGMRELNALFALLMTEAGEGSRMPEAWKGLTKVKKFADKNRLACSGMDWCARTYIYKDNGDSFVLVTDGPTAGWFDAAAAAKETNLPSFAMFGIPWN